MSREKDKLKSIHKSKDMKKDSSEYFYSKEKSPQNDSKKSNQGIFKCEIYNLKLAPTQLINHIRKAHKKKD